MYAFTMEPMILTESPITGRAPGLTELDDKKYKTEVLGLPSGVSENQLDEELISKANGFGIPASILEKRNTGNTILPTTWSHLHDKASSTPASSTVITPHSSVFGPPSPILISAADGKDFCFSQYDRYLAALESNFNRPQLRKGSLPALAPSSQSIFSISTKKSFSSVSGGLSGRKWWKKKAIHGLDPSTSCHGCRSNVSKQLMLHSLDCNHAYCAECLRLLVSQSIASEVTMPPRCCAQPLPSSVIEGVLQPSLKAAFLKAVEHYNTPKESRTYCANNACAKFIPLRMLDSKHPFDVTCTSCNTRVCTGCKKDAHAIGRDCPSDWELEALVRIGQRPAWKRCYNCQNLAGLRKGASHITCKCSAELCHLCAAVWDPTTGCPNLCSDEEELERRRQSEESVTSSSSPSKLVQRKELSKASKQNEKLRALSDTQKKELQRFCDFMHKTKSSMRVRHSTKKLALIDKHTKQQQQLQETHSKATADLEDRQIAAEIELRATLEQSERSVNLRLKHMEAYCNTMKRNPGDSRVVTERDLQELEQQYSLRDGMERQHQAKINVMRDRQTKRMEELLDKQETEREEISDSHLKEVSQENNQCAAEEVAIEEDIRDRQIRLNARWSLQMEVLCKEQSDRDGLIHTRLPTPAWPEEEESK